MEFQSLNYFSATQNSSSSSSSSNNNNNTATKRKLDNEDKQFESSKRMHLINTSTATTLQQPEEQNMPAITYASPDYKPNFQLSANATANMANSIIYNNSTPSPQQKEEEEEKDIIMMMEDDLTDEDEVLQTPSYMSCFTSYIPHDIGEDLDQGGFTGSLELGWSEMFNEM